MPSLVDKPGLLFVAATLLPLAAFVLLLLLGGLRHLLRSQLKDWDRTGLGLDALIAGKAGFFGGFAAIVVAFFCSFSGFCLYLGAEHSSHAEELKPIETKLEEKREAYEAGGEKDRSLHKEIHGSRRAKSRS